MALTLVSNPGSSSKKYALYRDGRESLFFEIAKQQPDAWIRVRKGSTWVIDEGLPERFYTHSIERVFAIAKTYGVLSSIEEIDQVGVRVVAPGQQFQTHQLITPEFLKQLRAKVGSAPLHIPPVLKECEYLVRHLPNVPLVAVSDSAFHSQKPEHAAHYTIPDHDARRFDIYRFGYHGLSVASVMRRLHAVSGHDHERVIVCHLGSGASITAVKNGVGIDTSMGFSPGSGLVMASRAGDLEPGAVIELMRVQNMTPLDMYTYMQTRGGLQGVAGINEFRLVIERAAGGDESARKAMRMFAYSVKKHIGAFVAALGGLDCLVVTATAGERSPVMRRQCLSDLDYLGISLDHDRNEELAGKEGTISPSGAPVQVVVMRTDEMEEMRRQAEAHVTPNHLSS